MTKRNNPATVAIDWLTTIAISATAVSLEIAFHEGVHAVTCLFGGTLLELSALHVDCMDASVAHGRFVAGSASIANIILGFLMLLWLRRSTTVSSEWRYFLWLFMLMNWLNGAGYWMFSGIANIGDWATVIDGWEPQWVWRVMMTIIGTGCFAFFVWFALKEFGKIVGGQPDEQIGRAVKLTVISYGSALIVVFFAGLFNPYGLGGLPAVAGLLAIAGGFSPLAWMMQWFRAETFKKATGTPLEIQRNGSWVIIGIGVVFVYVFILGRTIYF